MGELRTGKGVEESGVGLADREQEMSRGEIEDWIRRFLMELANTDSQFAIDLSQTEQRLQQSVDSSGEGVERPKGSDIQEAIFRDMMGAFDNHLEGWRRTHKSKDPESWQEDSDFNQQMKRRAWKSLREKMKAFPPQPERKG